MYEKPLEGVLADLIEELRADKKSGEFESDFDRAARARRRGSRYVGPGADTSLVQHVADGGEIRAPQPSWTAHSKRYSGGLSGVMTKALAEGTGSSGGYLVPEEVSAEVMRLVRARSAIMRLGPRTVPVKNRLSVVSLSTGASAAYVAENATIPTSEQTFAETGLLSPKTLAALTPISTRLLRDASESPSVEQVIREDLAEVLALRQDLAFVQGPGGSEPLGFVNHAGLTPARNLGVNGRAIDFDDLKAMVAAVRMQNAPFERPGWLFHPHLLSRLELLKDGDGRYLADAGLLSFAPTGAGGTLLGYRFATSTQIPVNVTTGSSTDTSYIVFGSDWQEAWVGENESLSIEASSEASYTPDGGTTWISSWQNQQVVFRASPTHDFALRRPQFFTVMQGVRP